VGVWKRASLTNFIILGLCIGKKLGNRVRVRVSIKVRVRVSISIKLRVSIRFIRYSAI